jgi:hypothetical protein
MPTNGGNGPDGGGGGNTAQQEYELLGFTRIDNFSADPSPVNPFGTTTLSWTVTWPSHLHSEVTVRIGGTGNEVDGVSPGTLSGRATVTLSQTTIFGLVATTPAVQRMIGTLTVPVNESECKTISFPAFLLTNQIKQAIDQALQGRLTGNGSTVTPGDPFDGFISIAMTLSLQGQDTMDISMKLEIQLEDPAHTGGEIVMTALGVVTDVHLSGFASICEGACSQIAQAFMTEIANNQIIPGVLNGLNGQVQQAATSAQAADPHHREFVLTSLTLTSMDLTFVICPLSTATTI